jgi:hypothetical protein
MKNWQELKKPSSLDVKSGGDGKRKATFVAEPLERSHAVLGAPFPLPCFGARGPVTIPLSTLAAPPRNQELTMAGFKDPDFNERRAASQKAREQALAKLKARPAVDEAELARRRAAAEAREAAAEEKRRAARAAKAEAEEAARAEQARADAEAAAAPQKREPTEEERKAARDARYAARKKNKKR